MCSPNAAEDHSKRKRLTTSVTVAGTSVIQTKLSESFQ